uniref:Putative basic tail protein n=1 Tax=Ixodes ricinus TaxID=34613 RepID=A0A0K8RLQ5_IXORI
MGVKISTFLQIAAFIAFCIHLIAAGQVTNEEKGSDGYELFTVEYCGTNCSLLQNGSWTTCPGKNGTCRCFHESNNTVGLCLSTEYTDFNDYPTPNSEEIKAASPVPKRD